MKKLQKIFSVLLALSMLACLLSVGVLADTETPDEPQNDPQTEAVQPPPTEPPTQPATGDGDLVGVNEINLDKNEMSVEVGSIGILTATIVPEDAADKTVTWSSSDETVASVSDGKVTGIAAGTATITATASDKTNTASCNVTVTDVVAATGITLNKGNISLSINGSFTLSAAVQPENASDKTVIWSSSNEKVAAVADGKITALSAGEAIITASVGNADKAVTATCAVSVSGVKDGAVIGGDNSKVYSTILAAAAEAKDGDTITAYGIVPWGGNNDSWPEGTLTISSADDSWIEMNYGSKVESRTTDFGCNIILTKARLSFCGPSNSGYGNAQYMFANGFTLDIRSDVFFANWFENDGRDGLGTGLILFGGSRTQEVGSSNLLINGGRFNAIYGGGCGHDVKGDVNITIGSGAYGTWVSSEDWAGSVGGVYGGSMGANVGGDTNIVLQSGSRVLGIVGGCVGGNVGGSTTILAQQGSKITGAVGINPADFIKSIVGGCLQGGSVAGNTKITVEAGVPVSGGIVGGCIYTGEQKFSSDYSNYITAASISEDNTFVGGDTSITMKGSCSDVIIGGGYRSNVNGNTGIDLYGTAYSAQVIGGGYGVSGSSTQYQSKSGKVGGNTSVNVRAGASITRIIDSTNRLQGGTIIGGSYDGSVGGNTNVIIDSKIGSDKYGALVFGGCYSTSGCMTGVGGQTNVTVNAAPYECTDSNYYYRGYTIEALKGLNGFYGSSFNCDAHDGYNTDTNVVINADLGNTPVYGGGLFTNMAGSTSVTIGTNGSVNTVYACNNNGKYGPFKIDGNATILVKGKGHVGTAYGYVVDSDVQYYADNLRNVKGMVSVIYDGNTGTTDQIINADLVKVTNGSDVTIDNAKADNRQLVGVKDLAIDKSAKLTLLANAAVSGNYTGDGTGTLAVPANAVTDLKSGSARLTLGGSVIGKNNISIADNGGVKPAVNQIYVKAANAKTDAAESFGWLDARNGVKMAQRVESGSSVWYLAAGPSDPVTPVVPTPVPTDPGTVIPDPDVPTTDEPTTDIPDDNTPKADAGKQTTGDSDIALISGTVAVISLGGLVYVSMKGKKEDK